MSDITARRALSAQIQGVLGRRAASRGFDRLSPNGNLSFA